MSFLAKLVLDLIGEQESSYFSMFWTPAPAGVTILLLFTKPSIMEYWNIGLTKEAWLGFVVHHSIFPIFYHSMQTI